MKPFTLVILLLFSFPVLAAPKIKFLPVFDQLQFDQPVLMLHAGDDSGRLFVVEQGGLIKVFEQKESVKKSLDFFNIKESTANKFKDGGEEGLLGLAFDPDYKKNGYFYVYYSAKSPRRSVISRFSTDPSDANQALASSEQILMEIKQPWANHNGGMLAFGPDGYLYIGTGDGGSSGDPKHNAQNKMSFLGKILRVDVNGQVAKGNPFVGDKKTLHEIWALGLRNPWRFSFDRETGLLWAADVGQNDWEEVNIIEAGGNYGWRWFEGTHSFDPDSKTKNTLVTAPIFEYNHNQGGSITGGYVYRGSQFPSLQGWYLFGDFSSGALWALNADDPDYSTSQIGRISNPSAFGEDSEGELYVVSYRGDIFHVVVDH